MSFFKRFEDLSFKDKDEKPPESGDYSQDRSYNPNYPQQPYYGQPQPGYPPQPPYGQQQQQPYGQPYQQSYGPTPPQFAPPPLPQGWTQHWEHNAQRAYWVEQATGRSQWEQPPGYGQPPAQPEGYDASRGESGGYYGGAYAGGGDYAPPPQQYYGQEYQVEEKKEKKDKGFSTGAMVAAGVGGLAVGAIGGALIANELASDSESEENDGDGDGEASRRLADDATGENVDALRQAERDLEEAQAALEEAEEAVYDDDE